MKAAVIGTIMPWSGGLSSIPDGWIICDGSSKQAREFPLLVQAIGDTYNLDPNTSNLGGAFPNYQGDILLPNLNGGQHLMDIEEEYFDEAANGGTGKAPETDAVARNLIAPYIGPNVNLISNAVFTDVRTDVEFTLNDRLGYSGNIRGNSIIDGIGEKVMYIGGRKLGHQHIRPHTHSGVYETLNNLPVSRSGKGVIPWDNVEFDWTYQASDDQEDGGNIDTLFFAYEQTYQGVKVESNLWSTGAVDSYSGVGGGREGRTIAQVGSENPPVNIYAKEMYRTPVAEQSQFDYQQMEGGDTIPYALFSGSVDIPTGQQNYYSDFPGVGNFGTFLSNSATDWLQDNLIAHTHEPFEIVYDQGSLKPQSSLIADVNIPVTTTLDNDVNKGALQIDMNTSQPSVTCVYIIRAY